MTDAARFVQDHPYQMLYGLIGLAVLLVINAFLRPATSSPAAAVAAPAAPAAARTGGALSSLTLAVVILGGAFYVLPLLQGQLGQGGGAAVVAGALTSGTYRGLGSSPLGSADLTLELDLLSSPKRVTLNSPTAGRFRLDGQVTPESGGTYLSGTLVNDQGVGLGTIKAHVTPSRVTGTAGIGPAQWQLDLRR